MTAAERAARGAAFLDETRPGWHQRIDLERLSMHFSCDCVFGQLDPEPRQTWGDRVEAFGLDYDDSEDAELGFSAWYGTPGEWAELDAAWRALIAARQPPEYQHPDGGDDAA